MSATAPLRAAAPQRRPSGSRAPRRTPNRPLRLVEPPATTPGRLAFVVLIGAVLGGGLVVLLLLHTLAAQDAFTLHRLQHQAATLNDAEQELTVANQQAAAPSALARRARALGMVPTGPMTIEHRRNGRLVGVATAAYVPAPPAPAVTPTPSAAAKPSPTASPSTSPSRSTSATRAPAHRHRSHPH